MAVELQDIVAESGEHAVHFYSHDIELAQALGSYLVGGIEEGAVALAIVTESHRRMLEAELVAAGLDPEECRGNGSLILLDAAATMSQFVDRGGVDPTGFRRVVGGAVRRAMNSGRPVRAFGEMVALLWDAGDVPGAIELEKAWNELARELRFALICGYRSESVQGGGMAQALAEICDLHSTVLSPPHPHDDDPISARFPAAGDAPRRARHFVTRTLQRRGRRVSLVSDAQLVVTELATNAVLHARSGFSVELRPHRNGVRLAIHDASPAEPVLQDPDPDATSGRGLRIVAALASDWGVAPTAGGKTVWAELRY